jgi:very-short-patch-repair endonuclease
MWRFDYAWPEQRIAIEQEGGVWVMGRHSRGYGMVKDAEKYNRAALEGWIVLRFTPQQMKKLAWVPLLIEAMGRRREHVR